MGSKPRVIHIYQMLPFLLLDHDGGHHDVGHLLRVWHSHHRLYHSSFSTAFSRRQQQGHETKIIEKGGNQQTNIKSW